MKKYVVSLDQGTSSSRAVVFNKKGAVVALSQKEHIQIYPKKGWVEHNPLEILKNQLFVFRNVIKKAAISPEEIASVGIVNQRETVVAWNKKTGAPVYNAIVWQDNRTQKECFYFAKKISSSVVKEKTGLIIDTYFSATKISWILKNVPKAKVLLKKGSLLVGTIDSWLLWNLTDGRSFKTDFTNASRTLLFNIKNLCWDEDLLASFNIPKEILPEPCPSSFYFGNISFKGSSIPIAGIAGDQQAALFGQQCFNKGDVKNTYGTGCFLLLNTGSSMFFSKNGLITTLACSFSSNPMYALEGSVFVGGAVMQWLRDNLGILASVKESDSISKKTNESSVFFVPAFSGLGAPHWDMAARGGILGLTQHTNKKDIIKAALESLAFQSKDVFDAMICDSNIGVKKLNVDGGATQNNYLMQFQADILNKKISRSKNVESSALGAAFLSGLNVGFWQEKNIRTLSFEKTLFNPRCSQKTRKNRCLGWKNAVERCKKWDKNEGV